MIVVEKDNTGQKHLTRAFNIKTVEQLNARITGYEAMLHQMTATSFDFFIYVIFLLFAEEIEDRIAKKDRGLAEDESDNSSESEGLGEGGA